MDAFYRGASSSKGKNNNNSSLCCFYCKSETTNIKNGWQLCSGDLAFLCDTCGSAYEDGSFCTRFHGKEDGWRDCSHCGKLLHCGCITSLKDIILLDFGGVCCLDCRKKHLIRVVNMPVNDCPDLWYNLGSQSVDCNPKDKLTTGLEEPMTVISSALSPETDVQLGKPRSPCKVQTSAMAENSIANSSTGIHTDRTTGSSREIIVYTRRKKLAKNNLKVYTRRSKSG